MSLTRVRVSPEFPALKPRDAALMLSQAAFEFTRLGVREHDLTAPDGVPYKAMIEITGDRRFNVRMVNKDGRFAATLNDQTTG